FKNTKVIDITYFQLKYNSKKSVSKDNSNIFKTSQIIEIHLNSTSFLDKVALLSIFTILSKKRHNITAGHS
ncbi:hypothetical protein AAHQ94_14815, partial [Listeria monocytogenes]